MAEGVFNIIDLAPLPRNPLAATTFSQLQKSGILVLISY